MDASPRSKDVLLHTHGQHAKVCSGSDIHAMLQQHATCSSLNELQRSHSVGHTCKSQTLYTKALCVEQVHVCRALHMALSGRYHAYGIVRALSRMRSSMTWAQLHQRRCVATSCASW